MTKINQEEYKFLKNLDDKWKWIARDGGCNSLNIFSVKPIKVHSQWDYMDVGYKHAGLTKEENKMFQFIRWEDENPYSIAELIEEYEDSKEYKDSLVIEFFMDKAKESEETEVKKDIKWLKREICKELEAWHGVEGGIDEDGINEIMLLINQFEESKVKQLERKIKELDSYNDELIRDNNQFRDELDNQEALSQDWIDSKKMWIRNKIPFHMDVDYAVPEEELQNLLVPKQELPVIPKFVADWVEEYGGYYKPSFLALGYDLYSNNITYPEVDKWIADNQELFARAWLDGYAVEEGQKYYVMNNDNRMMLVRMMDGKTITESDPFMLEDMYEGEKESHRLTEQEIKDYDPRYWAFAKPVEELE